jgi:oligoribonuclease
MTSNAFAALQGLNDSQLRAVAASSKAAKKTKATAAAAADKGSGNNNGNGASAASSSAPASTSSTAAPSTKKPPLPPPPPAGGDDADDDDGFTPVVTKGGKRAAATTSGKPPSVAAAAAAAATTATAAATKTAPASKKNNTTATAKDASSSKTWADEIEEHEEQGNGAGTGAADADANGANEAAPASSSPPAAAAADLLLLKDPLVWVDLEMTGLDVRKDTIIEIAVMVSDGQLRRVIEGPEIAIHHPDSVLDDMNEWSREQHAKSGLSARCRASAVSLAEAEEQVLAFVKRHCAYQAGILAGNSVHVDRAFLMHRMPKLLEHLHYRIVDVSSVAELARRWHPKVWREAPKKKKQHTALADVRESLQELRYYRERLFVKRA